MNLVINDWLDVQEGCYRYLAIDDGGEIKIQVVIAEYLLARSLGSSDIFIPTVQELTRLLCRISITHPFVQTLRQW